MEQNRLTILMQSFPACQLMSGGLGGSNPCPTSDRQSRPLSDRLSTILPPTIGQATVDGAKIKERKGI